MNNAQISAHIHSDRGLALVKVEIQTPEHTTWAALTPEQARGLARGLAKLADQIEGVGPAHTHEWVEATTYADTERMNECTRCGAVRRSPLVVLEGQGE